MSMPEWTLVLSSLVSLCEEAREGRGQLRGLSGTHVESACLDPSSLS